VFANDSGLLQGTLELLVLKTLSWGPMHGYGIAEWIESATDDVLRIEEGSLYPALYRMSRKGWMKGEWGITANNRRAKYYALTKEGRRQLHEQVTGWQRLSKAVSRAIGTTKAPDWAR
jgi:PadR family transcriptional regulator, regulatory protein PadR